MDSILESIKKMLGISEYQNEFDTDLIIHINAAIAVMTQLGLGEKNFSIFGPSETWSDFIDESQALNLAKPYVYMKTKMVFDPPTGAAADAMNNRIAEYEWRINHEVEYE